MFTIKTLSTHRKTQLARSQRVLSNIVIGWKDGSSRCELVSWVSRWVSGKEPLWLVYAVISFLCSELRRAYQTVTG